MPKSVKRHDSSDKLKQAAFTKSFYSDKDASKWLSAIILTLTPIFIVINIFIKNPQYLTDPNAYANGHNLHSHTNEAIILKDLLKNGISNFWSSDVALGSPMFMNVPPLPTMITASLMIMFEKIISPLVLIRLIIILLVSMMPMFWYRGARSLVLPRLTSLIVSFLPLVMDSKMQNGLELDAIFHHGLYSNLFAMVLLPITVAKVYRYGMNVSTESPLHLLCLMYLCNKTFGLYCTLLAFVTCFVYVLTKEFSKVYVKSAVKKFLSLHMYIDLLLCWWTIPMIISFPYLNHHYGNGVLPTWQTVINSFANGTFFDSGRKYLWLTSFAMIGAIVVLKEVWQITHRSFLYMNSMQCLSLWLLTSSIYFLTLSFGRALTNSLTWLIPLNFNTEGLQLLHLHFCGAICIAKALKFLIDYVATLVQKPDHKVTMKLTLSVLLAVFLMKGAISRVTQRTSIIIVGNDFQQFMMSMKTDYPDGRLLTHQKLGTGGSWDMSNIPHLTGKPGLSPPSDNFNHGLSGFYLNVLTIEDHSAERFQTFMKLYNMKYIVVSNLYQHSYLNLQNLVLINTVDDVQFYQIRQSHDDYGYFGFVRLPGYIDGNLDHVREAVVTSMSLYDNDALLYLNPRKSSLIRKKSRLNVQVLPIPFYEKPLSRDVSLVNWKLHGTDIHSVEALEHITESYEETNINSMVIQEKRFGSSYHVVVDVISPSDIDNEAEKALHEEHLLLKVSYHPFWRCSYFPVNVDFNLDSQLPINYQSNRSSLPVHHVTPNLMAVSLPPGRYHVVFTYRFPGILKLIAFICTIVFINQFFNLNLSYYAHHLFMLGWKKCLIISIFLMRQTSNNSMSRYVQTSYQYCDSMLPNKVKQVLSVMTTPFFEVQKRCSILDVANSVSEFPIYRIGTSTFSKTWSMVTQVTSGVLTKFGRMSDAFLDDGDDNDDNDQDHQHHHHQHPQKQLSFVEELSHEKSLNDTEVCHGNTNVSFDMDTSIGTDSFYGQASPPTPPKHTKKSLRKRNNRMSSGSSSNLDTVDNTTPQHGSPMLKNLRKNSFDSQIPTTQHATSSRKDLIEDHKDDNSAHQEKDLLRENKKNNNNNRYVRGMLEQPVHLNANLMKSYEMNKAQQTIINDQEHYVDVNLQNCSSFDTLGCDLSTKYPKTSSFEGLPINSSDEYFEDDYVDSYTLMVDTLMQVDEHKNNKLPVPCVSQEININRMVSNQNDDNDDVFSPEHSSSPDLSRSSENFLSVNNSADDSLESLDHSPNNTAVKTDLYRLHFTEVSSGDDSPVHRNRFDDAKEKIPLPLSPAQPKAPDVSNDVTDSQLKKTKIPIRTFAPPNVKQTK